MPDRTPLEIANEILRLVEETAPGEPGVVTRDRNDEFLAAAYGRAYRCFTSIRDLAQRGEADDAAILTRALLSIGLRSLWLVQLDDPGERNQRVQQAARSYFEELRKAAREEATEGVTGMDADVARMDANIARMEAAGINPLPSDYDLARALKWSAFYTRVYRSGSDVAHYSIGAVLDGFLELTRGDVIGPVALKMPNPERADDVLIRACLTYGAFLEKSESVIKHGLTPTVVQMILEWFEALEAGEG